MFFLSSRFNYFEPCLLFGTWESSLAWSDSPRNHFLENGVKSGLQFDWWPFSIEMISSFTCNSLLLSVLKCHIQKGNKMIFKSKASIWLGTISCLCINNMLSKLALVLSSIGGQSAKCFFMTVDYPSSDLWKWFYDDLWID